MKKALILLGLSLCCLFLPSCMKSCRKTSDRPDYETGNSVPWDTPASWEGGMPGMGTMPNQGAPR